MSITLQEQVYFGALWAGMDTYQKGWPIILRDGWANPQVFRTETGNFRSGIVEKLDSSGHVTDVVIALMGLQDDTADASLLLGTIPAIQAQRAVDDYEAVLHDPRYADSKIHVVGMSNGGGLTEYVLAYSIATYGEAMTDARADFSGFAAAPYGEQSALHFGIDPHEYDGRFTNYVAANDFTLDAGPQVGTIYYLPAREAAVPLAGALEAHQFNTFSYALGLPDWLSADEQAYINQTTTNPTTTNSEVYATPGMAPLLIQGDGAGNHLIGMNGNDTIIGGLGSDTMTGGGGSDVFRFNTIDDSKTGNPDLILDFQKGDLIDLSNIDAIQNSGLLGDMTNNAFQFIGDAHFTAPGQVSVIQHGNMTYILGNVDSNLNPDFMIELTGHISLSSGDFFL